MLRVEIYRPRCGPRSVRQWSVHRWTLTQALAALERGAPGVFCFGSGRHYVGLAAVGAGRFVGQRGAWTAHGRFRGAMLYDGLRTADARRILIAVFAGCTPERCFGRYRGELEPWAPEHDGWVDWSRR